MKWSAKLPTGPKGWPAEWSVVENRSDRIWIFGWLRLAPAILWFGGLLLLCVFGRYLSTVNPWIVVGAILLTGLVPVCLDRSRLLDPVDFIALGPSAVYVKRLAGRRAFSSADVAQIQLSKPADEDYDERQRTRRYVEVVIRFHRQWPYRLLVSPNDAAKIVHWAGQHSRPVVERAD